MGSRGRFTSRRGSALGLLLVLALAVGAPLLAAGPALAAEGAEGVEGGNAFSELSRKANESSPEETTTATKTTNENSSPTNSGKTLVIVLGAAVIVLSVVGYVIVRDARRVAPAGEADLVETRSGADHAVRRRKRRAKAKAARQQRKRNR